MFFVFIFSKYYYNSGVRTATVLKRPVSNNLNFHPNLIQEVHCFPSFHSSGFLRISEGCVHISQMYPGHPCHLSQLSGTRLLLQYSASPPCCCVTPPSSSSSALHCFFSKFDPGLFFIASARQRPGSDKIILKA